MLPRYQQLRTIVRLLKAGAIIAYPTEAVFGLGCDPNNREAVHRLLAIKQRSVDKGLILIAADMDQLQPFLNPLTDAHRVQLQATWPGPVTWLLPSSAPNWLRGRYDTLAVRITAHPVAATLCKAWGQPLVSTSANLSGHPPLRSALAVRRQLGKQLDYVVSGCVGGAKRPSEIRDGRTGQVVRPG